MCKPPLTPILMVLEMEFVSRKVSSSIGLARPAVCTHTCLPRIAVSAALTLIMSEVPEATGTQVAAVSATRPPPRSV